VEEEKGRARDLSSHQRSDAVLCSLRRQDQTENSVTSAHARHCGASLPSLLPPPTADRCSPSPNTRAIHDPRDDIHTPPGIRSIVSQYNQSPRRFAIPKAQNHTRTHTRPAVSLFLIQLAPLSLSCFLLLSPSRLGFSTPLAPTLPLLDSTRLYSTLLDIVEHRELHICPRG
jgi:hypothetical protein